MKVVLAVSSIRSDRRVLELCELAASPGGRAIFDTVVVVDSLGDGSIDEWIRRRGLADFIDYEDSRLNLGSAGNLARRLEIGVERGADYLFAVNHDGDLRLDVVAALVNRAGETQAAAVYPLSQLAPGLYDLTGSQPFPLRPVRRHADELPDEGLIDVFWSCSNGALYSLEPPRRGILPPRGLWHGQEDLAYGLLLARAGHRQVVDLGSRIEMRYEMRPVKVLGRTRLVSDKAPWLSYYFARNLLLVALRYAPRPSFAARALARIGLETAVTVFLRSDKRSRLLLLARGTLDGLRRREGLTVTPTAPATDAPTAIAAGTPTGAPGALVLYVVTSPLSADRLLRGQLARVAAAGFRVAVVSAPGADLERAARREGVEAIALPMRREISPLADLMSLARLFRLIRRRRPAIVNASTPKAGLLAMVAARAARVPVRIYTLRGLRLETTRGLKRRVLAAAERRAAAAAHRVVAVSPSLAHRYRELDLCPREKIVVLAAGSSNGVRRPGNGDGGGGRGRARRELGIDETAPVVGFVGRLTRDKGAADLAAVFDRLSRRLGDVRLLVVGDFEPGDPVDPAVAAALRQNPRVVITGFVAEVSAYYRAMDVLAFPSYREGFPNAPLEAAMAGVPTVGFAVTGTVDAVVDASTGRLVAAGDRDALAGELRRYLERPDLAAAHGMAARRRAERDFYPERVWRELLELYRRLAGAAGIPTPPADSTDGPA